MKNVICIVAIIVLAIVGIAWINYNNTHHTGYIYTKSGASYDNGWAKGEVWSYTGTSAVYSIEELRNLGHSHQTKLTGLFDGPQGVAIELTQDIILVVPGVGLGDEIAESYGIF